MKTTTTLVLLLITVGIALAAVVDRPVIEHLENNPEVEVLVFFKEQFDTEQLVQEVQDVEKRAELIVEGLQRIKANTMEKIEPFFKMNSIQVEQCFYIVNMCHVRVTSMTLKMLESHDLVREIHLNPKVVMNLPIPEAVEEEEDSDVEWNVAWVNAPELWNAGYTGEGFIVGGADTGVQWNHPALIQQYRGTTNVSAEQADHDYNWWDAACTDGLCDVPRDDNGHGTHTVGTSAGSDHNKNLIGVAPDAKWIACRNMDGGLGTPATYTECLEFLAAPWDLNKKNPRVDLRPHVVINSYGCPPSEGCNAHSLFEATKNIQAAGVFMSVAAGNEGLFGCSTISDPPGIYSEVLTVAALAKQSNNAASYSSRGPVTKIEHSPIKPDIAAPGSSVRSSFPVNKYATLSGTSMATPNVAGAVLLLWQSNPELVRNIPETQQALYAGALRVSSDKCGSSSDAEQNYVYGFGSMNIYNSALNQTALLKK